jgi:hypothetical protein
VRRDAAYSWVTGEPQGVALPAPAAEPGDRAPMREQPPTVTQHSGSRRRLAIYAGHLNITDRHAFRRDRQLRRSKRLRRQREQLQRPDGLPRGVQTR